MPPYLRYGNTLTLVDRAEASGRQWLRIREGGMTLKTRMEAVEDEPQRGSQWTIAPARGIDLANHEKGRVRYGDIVTLGIRTAIRIFGDEKYLPIYFLTAVDRTDLGGGRKRILVTSPPDEFAEWRIRDQANPLSTEYVRFGDRIGLELTRRTGLTTIGFLSHPASGLSLAGATFGNDELWFVQPTAVPSTGRVTNESVSPSNAAAILTMPANFAKEVVSGITGALSNEIPGISLLGKVVSFFTFSDAGVDVWELIKKQVETLVDEKIVVSNLNNFKQEIDGLQQNLKSYAEETNRELKKGDLPGLAQAAERAWVKATQIGSPQLSLPHTVMAGTIHLHLLREILANATLFNMSDAEKAKKAGELKDTITRYTGKVATMREQAIAWRESFINDQVDKRLRDPMSFDNFAPRKRVSNTNYKQLAIQWYEEQLDAFMLPSRLWKYLPLDTTDLPVQKTVYLTTGPFGYIGASIRVDDLTKPLTKIETFFKGNRAGIQIFHGSDASGWQGVDGGEETQTLEIDEHQAVIRAWGGQYDEPWFSYLGLRFRSRIGTEIGGGTTANPWEAELPLGSYPSLAGISTCGRSNLVGAYLHWRYTAWE
jgi:hypothetical protein